MPARLTVLLATAALALALPGMASASTPANDVLTFHQGSPLLAVRSMSTVPQGWHSSAGQASLAAEHTSTMQALHRRMHPLHVYPFVWSAIHPYWYVMFTYHGKIVADANVSPDGKVTGVWTGAEALAPYTHGNLAWALNSVYILVPACLLFMLAFFDPRRLRRTAHFDALAILAFLISYELLAHGQLVAAVWLVYPPLLYLLARLLKLGFRGSPSSGRLAPLLSTRTLLVGLPLLLVVRIVISLLGRQELDVGYESVIGAYRILHHLPLYWNDPSHGDTYGPVTYLAYVPFELIFPWKNSFSHLHAADLAAIVFDLATLGGLILLGRRLRPSRRQGTRLGLVLAWGWAACPFTIIGLNVHTNDGLIAMLSVFSLLTLTSPAVSGALLGLAAAAKFSPAGLVPLLAAPRQRGLKGALVFVGAFLGVVAAAVLIWLPSGGLSYFWQRTIGYQMTRADVFSPWALHPTLHPIQVGLEVLALFLALLVAFVPRERSLTRVCALAGAVTIAIQLPATHWYYYYIMWVLPFALVALLARPGPSPQPEPGVIDAEDLRVERGAAEPVLVGA